MARKARYARAMADLAGRAVSVFDRIEVRGSPIPAGPVLVVANHQNALLDPLVIFRVAGRPTRPLARAPLFDHGLLGPLLRGIGGLPVYRRQDDPAQMHRNEATFRAAVAALRAGDALQIYPEGRSHSEPSIEPLRTGAARIALTAEAESGGRLGLVIVPIGLTWERKHRVRGRVLAEIGDPFSVKPWLTREGAGDAEAVRALTGEIARRLGQLTVSVGSRADLELISAADRIYSREKALAGVRERDLLADRVPRLRRFARGLNWLRSRDPAKFGELARRVRRVEQASLAAGARSGAVPRRYVGGLVARYVVREGIALIIGLPLAFLGRVIWYPARLLPRLLIARARPAHESVATYKLAASFFTVPGTVGVAGAAGFLAAGLPGAMVLVAVVPLLGWVMLAWRERWGRVREDVELFLRVVRRARFRARLSDERKALAEDFDEVLRRMEG